MKSKKTKSFATELLDDLLGTKDDVQQTTVAEGRDKDSNSDSDETTLEESTNSVPSINMESSNPFMVKPDTNPGEEKKAPRELDPTIKVPGRGKKTKSSDSENDVVEIDDLKSETKTMKLSESKIVSHPKVKGVEASAEEAQTASVKFKDIQASANRMSGMSGASSPAQASLVQSENLRIAQQRILELEEEISRLRTDNEALAAAGETLKSLSDKSRADLENKQRQLDEQSENTKAELGHLNSVIKNKNKTIEDLTQKNAQMEMRLSTNIQKIRVRERELENRLELLKMEGQALVRSKDEMILDLKRQIDQLGIELESYRNKGQELNQQLDKKQETLSRTVKALRLALSLLEGGGPGSGSDSGKKAS